MSSIIVLMHPLRDIVLTLDHQAHRQALHDPFLPVEITRLSKIVLGCRRLPDKRTGVVPLRKFINQFIRRHKFQRSIPVLMRRLNMIAPPKESREPALHHQSPGFGMG